MPRPPRIMFAGAYHHLVARGNNKMPLFRDAHDFRVYRKLWVIAKSRFGLKVHRWCFMTNHIHLLIRQLYVNGVSEAMHFIQGRYARYFSRKYAWVGHVWQGRFSNRLILDDEYLGKCAAYIENNPVEAKCVEEAADYPWSSAGFYERGYRDPLTDADSDRPRGRRGSRLEGMAQNIRKNLFVGRRAVGKISRLRALSSQLGKDLLVSGRLGPYQP